MSQPDDNPVPPECRPQPSPFHYLINPNFLPGGVVLVALNLIGVNGQFAVWMPPGQAQQMAGELAQASAARPSGLIVPNGSEIPPDLRG